MSLYKRKNVLSHLPAEYQAGIDARIRAAYNMATESLEKTIKYLEGIKKYFEGIKGKLRKILLSTKLN